MSGALRDLVPRRSRNSGCESTGWRGYDLIKVHEGLTPEVYDALARTAREVDIAFGGHVPDAVGSARGAVRRPVVRSITSTTTSRRWSPRTSGPRRRPA